MDYKEEADLGPDAANKRACDSCRTRKIRCDRNVPCSNCRASKLTCVTTAPAQKVQRQRIHISEEYEKKIDRIEDRLASIENVLEALASKLGNLDIHRESTERSSHSRSSRSNTGRGSNEAEASTPAPFEGDTAIHSQSEFARELLAQAVGSTPSIEQNAEIKAALTSLHDLVSRQGQAGSTKADAQSFFNRSFAGLDSSKLERPPWDMVDLVLNEAATTPTMSFAFLFPFLKVQDLREAFVEAYDHPQDCPTGRRLLVYSVLYNLFTEFAAVQKGNSYRPHIGSIKLQVELALSQLDICVPPDYENVVALLMGAAYAVEICKPSLCWLMISRAAGLAQDLGYHRITTMKDDSLDERSAKIHLFWMIYIFDKTLSLRLGRASVIQDWDISLPFFFGGDQAPQGTEILLYWIKVAQVQGQTYEKLFSPAAFLQPPENRAQAAHELVDLMNKAWIERGAASVVDLTNSSFSLRDNIPTILTDNADLPSEPKAAHTTGLNPNPLGSMPIPSKYMDQSFGSFGDIFYHADVVMHYSTCALIQRAVSPDNVTFTQECLESSRAALVAHMRCNAQYNVKGKEDLWAGYVHWSILQAPFTPFIVIFCNVILHCDLSDLSSLTEFVQSLESCRTVSEGADKLYKMCHIFLQVAKHYVDAKNQERSNKKQAGPGQRNFYTTPNAPNAPNTDPSMNATAQFDPYLSALGLVPGSAWPMTSTFETSANVDAFTQGHGMDEMLAAGMGVGAPIANQNSVQDWFSGSRQLMSLLEDDIQMPDFGM